MSKECSHQDICGYRCRLPDNDKVRIIIAPTVIPSDHLLATFLDERHYDELIDEDCDFYAPPVGLEGECYDEHNIVFKLRKNVFTPEEQAGAYEGYIGGANATQNRGIAAGPKQVALGTRLWVNDWQAALLDALMTGDMTIDGRALVDEVIERRAELEPKVSEGSVWEVQKVRAAGYEYTTFFDNWLPKIMALSVDERKAEAKTIAGYISKTHYAAEVYSGTTGFFDRYPRIPYGRACAYNEKHPGTYAKAYPYIEKLEKFFAELLPYRYAAQKAACEKIDPRFRINNSVFTTVTVNKNFRTAEHYDAGDLHEGFSNLGVITNGKDYKGGYLVLPQFRVAVNVRPGDVLLINNHGGLHGNTEITGEEGYERVSVVHYFREGMLSLGSWEYESARRLFCDTRKTDHNHELYRPLWNGVSPGMWESKEWYDFLKAQPDGDAMLQKYEPSLVRKFGAGSGSNTLEGLFA